ncbi:PIN domain-like protein [Melanomma pulvis-pyrius CBS 109.77]|uniref:PIN domain-like protein n=1 Tax=Melanomma pulvis-pyrius CBS 109.77 TaxID=1314802 RepID=A0A6A6WQX6_9PLEO|nr:PIN domain-like protein [Melanomma pulvis-pyrius CBS 109.77]
MGISGLLPLLKSIQQPCNLKKFAGKTIGVDAYGWLHRGTAACAIDLALDKPTTKYVDFAMNRVRMLVHFGITPYLIFDGDYLPSKGGTETERAARRKESKRIGLELLKVGKVSQAQLELQKAVDVTPEMARMLIDELKHQNIQYIVAPYEADSQMAYMERRGIIDGILSEDSDLLVFGAKRLITKLDKFGDCIEINRSHFTACREISLVGWSDADFRRMAMLSGCDYLASIGNMGLKTAHRMLRKHKTVDRLIKAAQFDGKFKVPPGYLDAFIQAENTFLYQWVFCPISNQVINLTAPDSGIDTSEMLFLGEQVSSNVAAGVARGDLHPHTKEPIVVELKDRSRSKPLQPAVRNVSSTAQTPDMKHPKSIDSFFKPKRTPLAELDPNSFTPSPRQQALLQHNNGNGWAAVLAPQSHTQLRTAPQPARRALSDSYTARLSAPNPSKRQRLCSDSGFSTPGTTNSGVERSRFFASSLADPSPSLRTSKKLKTKPAEDVNIWSDDSIDDAMAELADLDDAASQSQKKIKVFKEEDFRSSSKSDSQSTTASRRITLFSQESVGTLTPASSRDSQVPGFEAEGTTILSAALSAQVKDLRSKFSYSSAATSTHSSRTSLPREASPKLVTKFSGAVPVATMLELVADTISSASTRTAETVPTPAEDDTNELEDSAWATMEAEVVVAASSPSTPATSRRLVLKGSEDLVVPDSEAESDCSPQKPVLNLGRFAFSG